MQRDQIIINEQVIKIDEALVRQLIKAADKAGHSASTNENNLIDYLMGTIES